MPTAPAPAEATTPSAPPAIASRLPDATRVPLRALLGRRLIGADTTPTGPTAALPKCAFTSAI